MHVLGKAGVGGCVFSLLKTTSDGVERLVWSFTAVTVSVFQYVVVTVCLKAGLETNSWTWVSTGALTQPDGNLQEKREEGMCSFKQNKAWKRTCSSKQNKAWKRTCSFQQNKAWKRTCSHFFSTNSRSSVSWKPKKRHFFSTLHHLSPVIFAAATLVAFVLLGNSRLNFHCCTQREPIHTQKSTRKWQLWPFATSCMKHYKGHSLMQTSFTEMPNNSVCVCMVVVVCVCLCVRGRVCVRERERMCACMCVLEMMRKILSKVLSCIPSCIIRVSLFLILYTFVSHALQAHTGCRGFITVLLHCITWTPCITVLVDWVQNIKLLVCMFTVI